MSDSDLTCPTCGKSYPDSECLAFDEGDFPDLTPPTLFPGNVLEFPCGHSQALAAGEITKPTEVDRRRAAINETVFPWERTCENF